MSDHTVIVCSLCRTQNPMGSDTCTSCGEPIAAAVGDPRLGSMVASKYRIDRKLGVGGMGTVYLASQQPLNRPCVLKLLNTDVLSDPANSKRFAREAEMASRVWHPNAVQIYDFDQDEDGAAYIAMEFIDGLPLSKIIKDEFPFSDERIIRLFSQLCDVLAAGHKLGIVHRDLKPDNIMVLDLPTDTDFVKLLDFGLAKFAEPGEEQTEITQAGWALGTPKYMAPEQCRGQQVTPQADVYALGVLLYYMLAGVLPFDGENVAALMVKHTMEKPIPPSKRARAVAVNPELERIALWAMEKKLDERLPSTSEFRRSLIKISETQASVNLNDTGAFGSVNDLIGDTLNVLAVDSSLESREGVVLVIDLVSEQVGDTPEAILSCIGQVGDILDDYGVRAETIGELRLKAGFGLSSNSGREGDDAIRAARRIIERIPESSLAIHAGIVEVRGNSLQNGSVVDLAERLAMGAPCGHVLITEDGARRSKLRGLRPVAPFRFKGSKKPIRLFHVDTEVELDGPPSKSAAARVSSVLEGEDWPMVGREELMHRLEGCADTLREQKGRSILLCGPPGVGKSRMLRELMLHRPKVQWIMVTGKERFSLRALFKGLGPKEFNAEYAHIVEWVMGDFGEGYFDLGPDELVRGAMAALRSRVAQVASQRPIGILIDDVDSGDPLFRSAIQGVIEDSSRCGVLVVMTSRPLKSTPQGMMRVDIPALLLDDCYALAKHIGGRQAISPELMRFAGGVPAAVVQLARAAKSGLLEGDIKLGSADDAERLRPVYEAWLDSVAKPVRDTLGVAAAIGDSFEAEFLAEVAGPAIGDMVGAGDLLEKGLVRQDDGTGKLRFASKLEAHVAYSRLSRGHRVTIHRQIAVVLSGRQEEPDAIAKHYEEAGDHLEALGKYREAAVMFSERRERHRAMKCYSRSCSLAIAHGGNKTQFLEDVLEYIPLLLESGTVGQVESLLEQAESMAEEVGEERLHIQVAAEKARFLISKNLFGEAGSLLNNLVVRARELRDLGLLADLLAQTSEVAERDGRQDEAIKYLTRSLEMLGRVNSEQSRLQAVSNLGGLGRILFRGNEPDKALATFRQQAEAARKVGSRMYEARALVNEAAVLQGQEKLDIALERLSRGLDLAREVGDLLTVSKALHNMAHVQVRLGQVDQAKRGYTESLATARSIRWREGVAMNHAWLQKLG